MRPRDWRPDVAASATPAVDFDLPGGIGVRLIAASAADVAAVARQLGPPAPWRLDRDPEMRVRFVSRIPTPGWRPLDARRSGYTDEGFYLLAGGPGSPKARIPLDALGGPCELVCERGVRAVPLLLEAVKLAALRHGLLPLHASAFDRDGAGVLLTGWPHGGKTAALLAFAQRGAVVVGDDVVLLEGDGRRVYGLAGAIEVADWQLRQLPDAWRGIGPLRRLAIAGLARVANPALRRRLRVRLSPEAVGTGAGAAAAPPRTLFMMVTHERAEIRVQPAVQSEVLQKLFQLAEHDRLPLLAQYAAYRFAFPGRRNRFLEGARELERERLRAALAGIDCWTVLHPRPVSLERLHDAMASFCPPAAAAPDVRGSA